MSYMNGDYNSMAEAVGDVEPRPLTFIPDEDFDPSDPDDVAAVQLAMDLDTQSIENVLRRENARLRQIIASYENSDESNHSDDDSDRH